MRRINPYATSEQELEWYFAQADAAIGHHAQIYEGGGGSTKEEQAAQMHVRRRGWEHQRDVRRRAAIEEVLGRLDTPTRAVLASVYTPRQWPWTSDLEAMQVRRVFRRGTTGSLLALALERGALVRAMAAHAPKVEPTFSRRLKFLELHCTQAAKRIYEPVRADADRALMCALEEFDAGWVAWERAKPARQAADWEAEKVRHVRMMSGHGF